MISPSFTYEPHLSCEKWGSFFHPLPDLELVKEGVVKSPKNCLHLQIFLIDLDAMYRTRAIISRGLYVFYPIFQCGLYFNLNLIYFAKTVSFLQKHPLKCVRHYTISNVVERCPLYAHFRCWRVNWGSLRLKWFFLEVTVIICNDIIYRYTVLGLLCRHF